jgi:hypothetical protein
MKTAVLSLVIAVLARVTTALPTAEQPSAVVADVAALP